MVGQVNSLALLVAEDGGFSDPTAELVFGAVEYKGKQATVKSFREKQKPCRS